MSNYGYWNNEKKQLAGEFWTAEDDRYHFNRKSKQTKLDSSRDWKTKWYSDRGFAHNLKYGLNMSKDGRYFTGESRYAKGTEGSTKKGRRKTNWYGKYFEILDFDAYGRDGVYASALQKRHGRRNFKTLQDIYDAEDVMSGKWQPAPPPPPPKPPAPPKKEVFKDVLGNPVNQEPTRPAGSELAELAKKQGTWRERSFAPTTNPQLSYEDFAGWMNQYNTANPQPKQIGYNDFSGWMQQYNTANPVAPPPPPKDTFGDFMGYMKQYNMMSGPQQQAPQFGYGVGGTASGGVQAANPYQNFSNYMQQFQAINPSDDDPSVTSSLLNI